MQLFRRFPKFHPLPREEQQVVPLKERSQYPAFIEDFKTLDRELIPYFRELDNEALQGQNGYRWTYIILIFGGALVTILGIVQLAFQTQWIAIGGAIVALILVVTTTVARRFNHQAHYLNARLAAERLRGEYFLFLGQIGEYGNQQDRVQKLIQRVAEINAKGGQNESA